MIKKIKAKLFEVISNKYPDFQIIDNMSMAEDIFPCIQIRLSGVSRDKYDKTFKYTVRYQIHIFSEYDGEEQVLDIESNIFNELNKFYELAGVVYVNEQNFLILDDKATGPVRKHGVITLSFTCAGQEQEVLDDSSQTSP